MVLEQTAKNHDVDPLGSDLPIVRSGPVEVILLAKQDGGDLRRLTKALKLSPQVSSVVEVDSFVMAQAEIAGKLERPKVLVAMVESSVGVNLALRMLWQFGRLNLGIVLVVPMHDVDTLKVGLRNDIVDILQLDEVDENLIFAIYRAADRLSTLNSNHSVTTSYPSNERAAMRCRAGAACDPARVALLVKSALDRMDHLTTIGRSASILLWRILFQLYLDALPQPVTDISITLDAPASSVSRLLVDMEAAGCIAKFKDESDQRRTLVKILQPGKDKIVKLIQELTEIQSV